MRRTLTATKKFICMFWLLVLFSFFALRLCYAEEGLLSALFQHTPILEDIELSVGATFVYQHANNANGDTLSKVGDIIDDTSYSIDLKAGKAILDFGKVFLYTEILGGEGVEDELKVYSNVNYDAGANGRIRLAEAWYEHYLADYTFTLTAGKLDATNYVDTNKYANNETTQFLGRMFVNSPIIEFGDKKAVGVRLGWVPNDIIDVEVVGKDANSDLQHLLSEKFFAGQINIKPLFFGRDDNFRFIGWLSDKDHTKWLDAVQTDEKGFGFGVSFDQELSDALGIFFRYDWQDPNVHISGQNFSLEYAVSAGLQLRGGIWGREDDVFGLAYGHIFTSDDYRESAYVAAKSENHLELYYNVKVNKYLTISPDFQAIWRPFGRDAANGSEAITVIGARGQVNF